MLIYSARFQTFTRGGSFADNDYSQMIRSSKKSYASDSQNSTRRDEELRSILFMDDENTLRLVVRLMLERLGYRVTTAENGQQALAFYQSLAASGKPFDAVILDINIENGMGGIETIKKLLQIDPNLKAIGASGSVTEETLEGLLKIGFSNVLAKPFHLEQLKTALEQLFSMEVI